jgi:hypothetical protein
MLLVLIKLNTRLAVNLRQPLDLWLALALFPASAIPIDGGRPPAPEEAIITDRVTNLFDRIILLSNISLCHILSLECLTAN